MLIKTHALQQEKPLQWEACGRKLESNLGWLQLEKAHAQQQRFSMTKNNK